MDKIKLAPFDNDFLVTIKDYIKIHLKPDDGTYYTILVDGKKAGVIGFKVENDKKYDLKIGIHQDFRGQGVFRIALDLLVRKHKIDKMYSEVAIANKASVKAHQKIGFKHISQKQENILKQKGLVYKRNMMLVKSF